MTIRYDLPPQDYFDDNVGCAKPSLNNSLAVALLTGTPAEARLLHPRLNPEPEATDPDDEGEADPDDKPGFYERQVFHSGRLDLGKAAHASLLGRGAAFEVAPYWDWRPKAARALRASARADGRIPVLAKHMPEIERMTAAAQAHWSFYTELPMFRQGRTEVVVTSINQYGDDCRSQLDWVHIDGDEAVLVDYKTSETLRSDWLVSNALRSNYHMQLAFYRRRLAENGIMVRKAYLFCQSISPPYLCRLVEFGKLEMDIAERMVDKAEWIWGQCLAANSWPGYELSPLEAVAPEWMIRQYEREGYLT